MNIEMDFEVWLKFQERREDEIGRFARKYVIYLRGDNEESRLNQRISVAMAREDDREGYRMALQEFSKEEDE